MRKSRASEKSRQVSHAAVAFSAFVGAATLVGVWGSRHGNDRPETGEVPLPAVPVDVPARQSLPASEMWTADLATRERSLKVNTGTLVRRDTISDLLQRLGTTSADAHAALAVLEEAELLDPRRLRPGLKATVTLEPGELENPGAPALLVGLSLRTEPDHSLLVTRDSEGGFEAVRLGARLTPQEQRISAEIDTSIYEAALAQGAGDQQVVDFARIFAYDIDFQREIHPGDTFEIVYETLVDERGRPVRAGEVIYAELDGRALTRGFYRFTPSDDGVTDYFDRNGESATKFLMKTPINGARLSSNFGMRRHPISGYSRLHKGTDFAAPTGTPIQAAGHGTVERASRYGGYGHYVRIRHANGYKTAYAHMSRYGPGVRKGRRVRQGDIIGYVGSTGASTGPHLHYEVYINGKPVNAMTLDLPTGRKLSGEMLEAFDERRREIDAVRRNLGAEIDVAEAVATGSDG